VEWAAATEEEPADGEACAVAGPGGEEALYKPVKLQPTRWPPSTATPVLNAELGAAGGENVVVIDGLVDGATRAALHRLLAGAAASPEGVAEPRGAAWERSTSDGAGLPCSWGLCPALLRRLERSPPPPVCEVQSRLSRP